MFDRPRAYFDPPPFIDDLLSGTFVKLTSSVDDTAYAKRDQQYDMPDSGRILAALEHEGGVLWQTEIGQTLDWSASKTSRRISELEESNRLCRYQIGRRKIVCLPGQEPPTLSTEHDCT